MVTEEELLKVSGGITCYGIFFPDQLTIYLQKPSRQLKKSVVLQTFWHEFSHAMLWVMNHKDWSREPVIDQMGHMLHQFHSTKEYE